MRWLLLLGFVLPACHLALPLGGARDGAADAPRPDLPPGQGDSSPRQGDSGPILFSSVGPETALSTASTNEDDPTLAADMLEIYFERDRDIWRAVRSSASAAWDPPALVPELSSPEEDGTPEISADGLTLYLGSDRSSTGAPGGVDVYVSTRSDRAAPWSTPTLVPELSSSGGDNCVTPTPDPLTVVLDSDRLGSRDLYFAVRAAVGAVWLPPAPLIALNTAWEDSGAYVTDQWVLFTSNRPDGAQHDIWYAERYPPALVFGTPGRLPLVNDPDAEDADPWLSPDGKTLYFASSRDGTQDIFVARVK